MRSITMLCIVLVCFLAAFHGASALPQDGVLTEDTYEYVQGLVDIVSNEDKLVEPVPEHHRSRRATCDLLSGFGVNDSACATHCILRGNRGGYCNSKKVCVCRK